MSGCGEENYEESAMLMDTAVKITARGENAEAAVKESFVRLEEIDKLAAPTGEVTKLAENAGQGKIDSKAPKYIKCSQQVKNFRRKRWRIRFYNSAD